MSNYPSVFDSVMEVEEHPDLRGMDGSRKRTIQMVDGAVEPPQAQRHTEQNLDRCVCRSSSSSGADKICAARDEPAPLRASRSRTHRRSQSAVSDSQPVPSSGAEVDSKPRIPPHHRRTSSSRLASMQGSDDFKLPPIAPFLRQFDAAPARLGGDSSRSSLDPTPSDPPRRRSPTQNLPDKTSHSQARVPKSDLPSTPLHRGTAVTSAPLLKGFPLASSSLARPGSLGKGAAAPPSTDVRTTRGRVHGFEVEGSAVELQAIHQQQKLRSKHTSPQSQSFNSGAGMSSQRPLLLGEPHHTFRPAQPLVDSYNAPQQRANLPHARPDPPLDASERQQRSPSLLPAAYGTPNLVRRGLPGGQQPSVLARPGPSDHDGRPLSGGTPSMHPHHSHPLAHQLLPPVVLRAISSSSSDPKAHFLAQFSTFYDSLHSSSLLIKTLSDKIQRADQLMNNIESFYEEKFRQQLQGLERRMDYAEASLFGSLAEGGLEQRLLEMEASMRSRREQERVRERDPSGRAHSPGAVHSAGRGG